MADSRSPPDREDDIDAIVATAPQALLKALEANDRFRRDTAFGRIFHPRKISFREVARRDSLHVIIDGNRVSAHVDEISPLNCKSGGGRQYSLFQIAAHNASGIWADLRRRVAGQHGKQRCHLECEVVWVDDEDDRGATPSP